MAKKGWGRLALAAPRMDCRVAIPLNREKSVDKLCHPRPAESPADNGVDAHNGIDAQLATSDLSLWLARRRRRDVDMDMAVVRDLGGPCSLSWPSACHAMHTSAQGSQCNTVPVVPGQKHKQGWDAVSARC
ncbi:hypothetical protein BP6252_12975 [Coleophoma cylindrospora]|uniref:Uncharacterized protein n=1 Tax=Coleophoma cylindrospora TaxID=1849047 RepID=A0A3D8QE35_9HELO|nr:hypothetical protein BP6252_12975 [Coleophoma cylindrospora]